MKKLTIIATSLLVIGLLCGTNHASAMHKRKSAQDTTNTTQGGKKRSKKQTQQAEQAQEAHTSEQQQTGALGILAQAAQSALSAPQVEQQVSHIATTPSAATSTASLSAVAQTTSSQTTPMTVPTASTQSLLPLPMLPAFRPVSLVPMQQLQNNQLQQAPAPSSSSSSSSSSAQPITLNIDVNHIDAKGNTQLHWAAHQGDIIKVNLLLKAGANVNAQAKNGATPILVAAKNGHIEIVQVLIAHGADINDALVKINKELKTIPAQNVDAHRKLIAAQKLIQEESAKLELAQQQRPSLDIYSLGVQVLSLIIQGGGNTTPEKILKASSALCLGILGNSQQAEAMASASGLPASLLSAGIREFLAQHFLKKEFIELSDYLNTMLNTIRDTINTIDLTKFTSIDKVVDAYMAVIWNKNLIKLYAPWRHEEVMQNLTNSLYEFLSKNMNLLHCAGFPNQSTASMSLRPSLSESSHTTSLPSSTSSLSSGSSSGSSSSSSSSLPWLASFQHAPKKS